MRTQTTALGPPHRGPEPSAPREVVCEACVVVLIIVVFRLVSRSGATGPARSLSLTVARRRFSLEHYLVWLWLQFKRRWNRTRSVFQCFVPSSL